MSQAETLLNSLMSDGTEPHIIINSNREVMVPDRLKRIAVQNDHNVETVTFDCPRYWDEHDMSSMTVYINYRRPDGSIGSYVTTEVTIDDIDKSIMHFDWTISRHVTKFNGQLAIMVCIRNMDENGVETEHWNSELNKDMYISEGMDCTDVNYDEESDIIADILLRLNELENNSSYTKEEVNSRLNTKQNKKKRYTFNHEISLDQSGTFELDSSALNNDDLYNPADEIVITYYTDDVNKSYTLPYVTANMPSQGYYYTALVNDTTFIWVRQDAFSGGIFTGGVVKIGGDEEDTYFDFWRSVDITKNNDFILDSSAYDLMERSETRDYVWITDVSTFATYVLPLVSNKVSEYMYSATVNDNVIITVRQVSNGGGFTGHVEVLASSGDENTVGQYYKENDEIKGEIFNDYDNNKAFSSYSTAIGKNNLAGTKGFTIIGWNENDKTYTLDSVENLTIGDRFSMEWVESYSDCGSIIAIDSTTNTITVDEFIIGSSSDETVEKELFIHDKPWLGTHSYGYGASTEGADNIALLTCSHSEGRGNKSLGFYSHTEGRNNVANYASHAEGRNNFATGDMAHAEGRYTKALGHHSHSEGIGSEDNYVIAAGNGSHAEGGATIATGDYSHAEGQDSYANGLTSHVEGLRCQANGDYSHSEGDGSLALGKATHAEGAGTQAEGLASHAEGHGTIASGHQAHAEGYKTYASNYSHAEGYDTVAESDVSHAEGMGTHAKGYGQHVQGRYNILDVKTDEYPNGKYAHIVGNGEEDKRSNAHTLDWNGNAWFAGDITVGENNEKLVADFIVTAELHPTDETMFELEVVNPSATTRDILDAAALGKNIVGRFMIPGFGYVNSSDIVLLDRDVLFNIPPILPIAGNGTISGIQVHFNMNDNAPDGLSASRYEVVSGSWLDSYDALVVNVDTSFGIDSPVVVEAFSEMFNAFNSNRRVYARIENYMLRAQYCDSSQIKFACVVPGESENDDMVYMCLKVASDNEATFWTK